MNLKDVVLSTTLKEIKSRAFADCYQIEPFYWGYEEDWANLVIYGDAFPNTITEIEYLAATFPLN